MVMDKCYKLGCRQNKLQNNRQHCQHTWDYCNWQLQTNPTELIGTASKT